MKFHKIIFTFLFITSFFIVKATDYTWTGSVNNMFDNSGNWSPIGAPGSTDNVTFNIGGDITVDIGFANGFNDLTISSNSNVLFISTGSDIFLNGNTISIDESSQLSILDATNNIEIIIDSGDIEGTIYLNNGDHKISSSTSGFLTFKSGSGFIAGESLTGYPFGNGSINNVSFNDDANYYHYGGNSPFGSSSTTNVTNFSLGSNYYIINDGSLVLFSNKTYGNIYIGQTGDAYINVLVNGIGTGTDPFSFNSITTENGSLLFSGSSLDNIKIYSGIDATSSNIELKAGTFEFIGDCYISSDLVSPHDVKFTSFATLDFTILDNTSSLSLDCDFTIESNITILFDGEIDFKTNRLFITGSDSELKFSNTAKLITANTNGINSSINGGTYTFEDETSFEYNGAETQNVNLPAGENIGKLIINNPIEVKMDKDIIIDSLFLEQGFFSIGGNHLTIKKNIEYTIGKLLGGDDSDLSFIDNVENITLNQDLTLDELTISGASTNVLLEDGDETSIKHLNISNGTFNLKNNSLRINNAFNLSGGELLINNGTLKIKGAINISGGNIEGGTNAKLELLDGVPSETIIPIEELSELNIEVDDANTIKMGKDLNVYNTLQLSSGILSINDNELSIHNSFGFSSGKIKGSDNSNLSIIEIAGAEDEINLAFVEGTTFDSLNIDREHAIINIYQNFNIASNLNLQNGFLNLNYKTLTLQNDAIIESFSENSYIITGEGGYIEMPISNALEIPLGTRDAYLPMGISSYSGISSTDMIFVRLGENTYDYTINTDTDDIVNLVWTVLNPNITDFDMELNWQDDFELNYFDNENAYLIKYDEGSTTWQEDGLNMISLEDNKITYKIDSEGIFAVSSNYAPNVENQELNVIENSPNGTLVGSIVVDIPEGKEHFFNLKEHENEDIFSFEDNGDILVNNSELFNFEEHPSYIYNIDACAFGKPIKCASFELKINIEENTNPNFFVTNYISPNGDGKNDTWIIKGLEEGTYSVAVHDGKGNVVFRSNNYKNNWDGTKYGNKLAPGVYYYSITSETNSQKGTITLVR